MSMHSYIRPITKGTATSQATSVPSTLSKQESISDDFNVVTESKLAPSVLLIPTADDVQHLVGNPSFAEALSSNPSLKAAVRSVFDVNKSYAFRMVAGIGSVTSSVGGTVNQIISFSPNTTSYSEWSVLVGLFDQVKHQSSRLYVQSRMTALSTANNPIFAFAPIFDSATSVPSALIDVQRRQGCVYISPFEGGGGMHKTLQCHPPKGIVPWADTLTPAIVSPPSGMVGGWWICCDSGVASVSTTYFNVTIETTILLRVRS